jgi:hypothetical protein
LPYSPSKVQARRIQVPTLRRGEFGRLVLAELRVATEPLSVAEIVERLAAFHGIDIGTPSRDWRS